MHKSNFNATNGVCKQTYKKCTGGCHCHDNKDDAVNTGIRIKCVRATLAVDFDSIGSFSSSHKIGSLTHLFINISIILIGKNSFFIEEKFQVFMEIR